MKRRGFTIVEMMMVVGIVAVLLTIVVTAATGAIKQARVNKANSLVHMVQAAIATYHAQYDEWPAFNPDNRSGNVDSETSNDRDYDRYRLTDSEADACISEVVKKSIDGSSNPLVDVMGLYVARKGSLGDKSRGMDMAEAIRGTKSNPKKMKLAEMVFGYPEADHGYFRRFKLTYSVPGDFMSVSK